MRPQTPSPAASGTTVPRLHSTLFAGIGQAPPGWPERAVTGCSIERAAARQTSGLDLALLPPPRPPWLLARPPPPTRPHLRRRRASEWAADGRTEPHAQIAAGKPATTSWASSPVRAPGPPRGRAQPAHAATEVQLGRTRKRRYETITKARVVSMAVQELVDASADDGCTRPRPSTSSRCVDARDAGIARLTAACRWPSASRTTRRSCELFDAHSKTALRSLRASGEEYVRFREREDELDAQISDNWRELEQQLELARVSSAPSTRWTVLTTRSTGVRPGGLRTSAACGRGARAARHGGHGALRGADTRFVAAAARHGRLRLTCGIQRRHASTSRQKACPRAAARETRASERQGRQAGIWGPMTDP
jgi:hypothetical protein